MGEKDKQKQIRRGGKKDSAKQMDVTCGCENNPKLAERGTEGGNCAKDTQQRGSRKGKGVDCMPRTDQRKAGSLRIPRNNGHMTLKRGGGEKEERWRRSRGVNAGDQCILSGDPAVTVRGKREGTGPTLRV